MGLRHVLLSVLLAVAAPSGAAEPAMPMTSIAAWFAQLQRPASPNHWLVAPADFVVPPDAVAPVYAVPAPRLREAFIAMLRGLPRVAIIAEYADGVQAVSTTAVFRFEDDVHVQFIARSPTQSTLAIHSASRVGYWDLGANRRRVGDWLARLQAPVAAP